MRAGGSTTSSEAARGRQGDPGESRFYLSLEDDLMSRFATGAMNWVMDKALPEDVPIEAGMVTKAIERAQNTVEQRNAETRKNVLKYDEVMNEQRKVIYQRRSQILDGTDLRSEALEHLEAAVAAAVAAHCEIRARRGVGPRGVGHRVGRAVARRGGDGSTRGGRHPRRAVPPVVNQAALAHYGEREEHLSADVMRQVERQVMLRLIDQRWRSHLREMDLLREGIHLRAMGQKDPATEWQREGFEMFGQMMDGIALDFVRYVMHVQLAEQAPEDAPRLVGVTASKSEAASPALAGVGASAPQQAAAAAASSDTARAAVPNQPRNRVPVVKSELEKVGRNQPCPCGSGKKYKMCHTAAPAPGDTRCRTSATICAGCAVASRRPRPIFASTHCGSGSRSSRLSRHAPICGISPNGPGRDLRAGFDQRRPGDVRTAG